MQLASQEAKRFQHEYIGTEHLLLGLVAEGSGVADNVLKNLDIDVRKIRREVEKIVQTGPDNVKSFGKLPQTPRAKKVIELAIEESRKLGHNYVGTEHLLLGLLREETSVAAQVLMNLGLRLQDVRNEIRVFLGLTDVSVKSVRDEVLDLLEPANDFDDENFDDEDEAKVKPELQHLPASAREIVAEFDCQIDVVEEEKWNAVGEQEWEKAADLRDLEIKLKKLRDDFILQWPKTA